jgi:UDP-glucose:(heptosyl)LPS alpha-1,3-glucosyltransferase
MPTVVLLKSHLNAAGGLEKYTLRLACAFAAAGCRTTVLTTCSKDRAAPQIHPDVDVISLGAKQGLSVANLIDFDKRCRQWLKDNPSDLVFGMDRNRYQTHYRAGNGVHAAFLAQRRFCEPWLKRLSFSLNPLHQLTLSYEKTAFEHPSLKTLFTNSSFVKEQILHYYSTPEEKIQVVHNGVEWQELQTPFEQGPSMMPQLRSQYGLSNNCFQLLFAGHGYRRKGLYQLFQGLAALTDSNIQLSIVGKDKEIDLFKSLAVKLGIAHQVFFFGAQPSLYPFYQMADALAVPSLYDPFANVTVEALAMGLFVITSKFNGGHEVLKSHSGLILEDLFDPSCMAAALATAKRQPKTMTQATAIRQSVEDLNFKNQLNKIVNRCID